MKRLLLILSMAFCVSFGGFSQSADEDIFYFDFMVDKIDDSGIDVTYLRSHPLGLDVAKKLELLRESYTWKEEASATVPRDRTIVEKPAIYYSVQKLNGHYKKAVKQGVMNEEEAKTALISAIDIALVIRYQQTAEFETKLRDFKKGEEIASVYSEKVKMQY